MRRRLGLLAAVLLAVAGCGGDSHSTHGQAGYVGAGERRGPPLCAAAHGVTAPALFAVARGDRYVPVADMRAVARAGAIGDETRDRAARGRRARL